MGILGWILFGVVVALFARSVMPERYPLGVTGMTALGVIGALVAGWLGQAFGWYGPDEGLGFIVATLGAIALISAYHLSARKRLMREAREREEGLREPGISDLSSRARVKGEPEEPPVEVQEEKGKHRAA